jgi:hypothetical protein
VHIKQPIATALAFLIASIFPAVVLTILEVPEGYLDVKAFLGWTLIAYFFTFGVTVVIGLPAYLLLKRFHLVTWWSAMLTGILGGVVMVYMSKSLTPSVVPVGGLAGLVFWLIWRCGKPGTKGVTH